MITDIVITLHTGTWQSRIPHGLPGYLLCSSLVENYNQVRIVLVKRTIVQSDMKRSEILIDGHDMPSHGCDVVWRLALDWYSKTRGRLTKYQVLWREYLPFTIDSLVEYLKVLY